MMELLHHAYKYYPYEIELARREAETLLPKTSTTETAHGLMVQGHVDPEVASRFVYYAGTRDGEQVFPTMQARLEHVNGNGRGRQSTRYAAHGMHEYKGKFNPQIVRAILNILGIPSGAKVMDPFCGSGTSLLECAHMGMDAIGTDINPLAVFIANAKLQATRLPVARLRADLHKATERAKGIKPSAVNGDDERVNYLSSWFAPEILHAIESLRVVLEEFDAAVAAPLLAIASNLLREYSMQDPKDLRVRRRKDSLPTEPFMSAYMRSAMRFLDNLGRAQEILTARDWQCKAVLADSQQFSAADIRLNGKFDCAITSPPYATALPYIEMQRLSLVWLGLVQPKELASLEARLIGSREVRGAGVKKDLLDDLRGNAAGLPSEQADYCLELHDALGERDGFRRRAVPILLYRYFVGMARVFTALRPLVRPAAPFALIVGCNRTVLGGHRFDIDTPQHLTRIAATRGWRHAETIPLQTYQRYGYHMNNAIRAEALVVLEADG